MLERRCARPDLDEGHGLLLKREGARVAEARFYWGPRFDDLAKLDQNKMMKPLPQEAHP
jgi:hypothetical protein